MKQPSKVTRIQLSRFRGWAGKEKALHIDADFVLIAAPNGMGKSSLLEALARALGGVSVHRDDTIPTIGATEGWRVEVEVKVDGEDPNSLQANEETVTFQIDQDRPLRRLPPDVPRPHTIRRATWFTQDPLDDQFESWGSGEDTLLGFLAPFPNWLNAYEEALKERLSSLRRLKPPQGGDEAVRQAERFRDELASKLFQLLARTLGSELPSGDDLDPWEHLPKVAAALPGGPSAQGPFDLPWFRGLLAAIGASLSDDPRIQRKIGECRAREEEARGRLEELEREWPEELSRRLSTWFDGSVDLDALLALLSGLAGSTEAWRDLDTLDATLAQLPPRSRQQVPYLDLLRDELLQELARLDAARAERARRLVDAWKRHWARIEDRRKALRKEIDQAREEIERLSREIDRHEAVVVARRLLDQQRTVEETRSMVAEEEALRRRWPARRSCIEAIENHLHTCARLGVEQLNEEVLQRITSTMNVIMKHFVTAGTTPGSGDAPTNIIALHRDNLAITPDFSDGRKLWKHFSTGQKAQDALAWLLSTNALLQHWLPHRLLMLDDLSTALDLTNLSAECALLRKFAYAPRDKGRKRQVLLATHHDQLTHRIYDLLLPPGEFTMCEVRLGAWSIESGPEVECYRIRATRAATDETRKELGEALARNAPGGTP